MTLQQLKYVVEISKCGSMTAAAKNLFIAQPSLSKAITALERELGITILERNRHGVAFTVEGVEFLGYANRVLEQAGNLLEHFNPQNNEKEAVHLSISAQHYIFVVDALVNFIQQTENSSRCKIAIREGRTSQVIHDVLIQKSQIGIIFISNSTQNFMNRLFAKNNIEFTPLRQFSPYVYINKQHPLAMQEALTLDDLSPYPYVQYEQGVDSYQYSEEIIIPESSGRTIYVTDCFTMLSIIKNTTAYTTCSGCLLPNIVDDSITSVPISDHMDNMTIGTIKLKNIKVSPEVRTYIGMLNSSLQRCSTGGCRLGTP